MKARNFLKQVSLAFVLSAWLGCTGQKDPDAMLDDKFSTTHFDFYYRNISTSQITDLGLYVEESYAGILADLKVVATDRISIHFYQNNAAVKVGSNRPDIPDWAIGLATARDQIHMIAPYNAAVSYNINNIAHEVAHCVSMYVNPSIPNNPRWLWESIAIYESRQFRNPKELPYMISDPPKTLADLNDISNTRIYDIGFLFTEFIFANWGKEKFLDLVKSNGDVGLVLGLSENEFMTQWMKSVRSKYNF